MGVDRFTIVCRVAVDAAAGGWRDDMSEILDELIERAWKRKMSKAEQERTTKKLCLRQH